VLSQTRAEQRVPDFIKESKQVPQIVLLVQSAQPKGQSKQDFEASSTYEPVGHVR